MKNPANVKHPFGQLCFHSRLTGSETGEFQTHLWPMSGFFFGTNPKLWLVRK